MFNEADVIFAYTRAQAIEDGLLVDVTATAKEAGFKAPVALTRRLWEEIVVPDPRARELGQDENGRLWDVLNVLRCTATARGDTNEIHFRVLFVMKARQRRLVTLKALCGPGDQGELVITLMLPEED